MLFNKAGVAQAEALSYAAQPVNFQRHPSAPPAAGPSPLPKVRKDFPETWLWQFTNIEKYVNKTK